MLLTLTCHSFSDFIFYVDKEMVIARVEFDETACKELSKSVLKFYFNYLLDIFISSEKKESESALFNNDTTLLHHKSKLC